MQVIHFNIDARYPPPHLGPRNHGLASSEHFRLGGSWFHELALQGICREGQDHHDLAMVRGVWGVGCGVWGREVLVKFD